MPTPVAATSNIPLPTVNVRLANGGSIADLIGHLQMTLPAALAAKHLDNGSLRSDLPNWAVLSFRDRAFQSWALGLQFVGSSASNGVVTIIVRTVGDDGGQPSNPNDFMPIVPDVAAAIDQAFAP